MKQEINGEKQHMLGAGPACLMGAQLRGNELR